MSNSIWTVVFKDVNSRELGVTDISEVGAEFVLSKGGVTFDGFLSAQQYADKEMYPAGYNGSISRARGKASVHKVEDFHIYIPDEKKW